MENNSLSKTDLLVMLATLAVASLLLAGFAFNRPLATSQTEEISYTHVGNFGYSADAPPDIYPASTVQVGEPIFRQLIKQLIVNFDYRLDSELPPNISGSHRLDLIIQHSNGWNWTIPLQPDVPFNGNSFAASGVIDLDHVQKLINNLEQQTGLQNQQYTLTVAPQISVEGTLAGQPLSDEFKPHLNFQLSPLQMQVAPGNKENNPFLKKQPNTVAQTVAAPNTLGFMGYQLNVKTVRMLALMGLVLFGGGALIIGLLVLDDKQGDQVKYLRTKYGSLLITIRNTDLINHQTNVEVDTIDDLAKIAERSGQMILHQASGTQHHYFVQDSGTTYQYRLTQPPKKFNPGHLIKARLS